ncbi:MAG: class I SAM-dependent methyltransferase [Gammaproteobacteria bacterium]|nr:class I SAM-dependent methyltransferase [Gammaproteobacteria bacterium]
MDSSSLSDQYQRRFQASADYRDQVWKKILEAQLQSLVGEDQIVLDLGCGWGEFSRNVAAKQKFAMDLNADAASHLDAATEFLHQDCSQAWPLAENSLDVVFSSNFIEHLPDKEALERTLEQALRCLKPGGRIILLGPNIRYVAGAYWDYWDHHIPLTDKSLAELLSLKGFEVCHSVDRFLPYSMSEGRNPPLFLVALYLRLPMAWKLFGKQFLVVARPLAK